MSACRSCGAEIIWVETARGKKAPLDADPEVRFFFVSEVNPSAPEGRVGAVKTYTSHFATCPDSDKWRNP